MLGRAAVRRLRAATTAPAGPPGEAAGRHREGGCGLWGSLAAYVILFAALSSRLLAEAAGAFGRGNNPVDSRLLAWTQAAVAGALADDPVALFDAPIFHPAPSQLAGAEAFLSSQIVYAPVFWLTGNAVLAANVLILLSYPLAALAMDRLLVALGAGRLVAWVGGLVFALGPDRKSVV